MFSFALFTAINSVSMEVIRSIDKFSTQKLANFMLNNLLYGVLRKEENRRPQKIINTGFLFGKNNVQHKVKTPYLPQLQDDSTYTLVLDLDETLVHFFYVYLLSKR